MSAGTPTDQYASLVCRMWGRRYYPQDEAEAWRLALRGTNRKLWMRAAEQLMTENPERCPSPAIVRSRLRALERAQRGDDPPEVEHSSVDPGPPDLDADDPFQLLAEHWERHPPPSGTQPRVLVELLALSPSGRADRVRELIAEVLP